jgi:hypothetical protein
MSPESPWTKGKLNAVSPRRHPENRSNDLREILWGCPGPRRDGWSAPNPRARISETPTEARQPRDTTAMIEPKLEKRAVYRAG